MASNWYINGFYDKNSLSGLFEATRRRVSCRSYAAAPSTEQWNSLLSAADTLALPGVRIALGLCDNSLFQPLFGLLMKFENVQRFAAIIVTDDQNKSIVNAGVSGEMFMLRAVELGLAGCWVSGTYKRGQVGLKVREGEKIVALIALGIPKVSTQEPVQRKRKALSVLCPDMDSLSPAFKEVVEYVQIAPSAMNQQPWRMQLAGPTVLTLSIGLPLMRLDLGIAVSHALLALGNTPAQFSLDADAQNVTIELL